MLSTRKELASKLNAPQKKYYGNQTVESMMYFNIGGEGEKMPLPIIKAFGILKKAAAEVNRNYGLDTHVADAICEAAEEVMDGTLKDHFPLVIWQAGSGCYTNINVNEVISNRAIEILNGKLEGYNRITKDDVNKNQNSFDVFAAAMHIAVAMEIVFALFPALRNLLDALRSKEKECKEKIKPETHMDDEVSLAMEKEFSEYASQIDCNIERIQECLETLYCINIDDRESCTDFNTKTQENSFAENVIAKISEITEFPFVSSKKYAPFTKTHDAVIEVSDTLNVIACSLMKIANGINLLGSGLDEIGEFILCDNEFENNACIVDPLYCEVISTIAAQVMGNHVATTIGSKNEYFKKNVYNPMMIANVLQSIKLISESCQNFSNSCVKEITINK